MLTPSRSAAPVLVLALVPSLVAPVAVAQATPSAREANAIVITAARQAVLDRISATSLEGHLRFISSDLLEGRDTPSRGQDLAAEYIAAQFHRASLRPAGNDGYFQTAEFRLIAPDPATFRLDLSLGDEAFRLTTDQISQLFPAPVSAVGVGLTRVDDTTDQALKSLEGDRLAGRAVVVRLPAASGADRKARAEALRARRDIQSALAAHRPALLVWLGADSPIGRGLSAGRLIEGGSRSPAPAEMRPPGTSSSLPAVVIHDPAAIAALTAANADELAAARFELKLGPPVERHVVLRNVAGLLPGSDPQLKDEYVIVSAHYDHVGLGEPAPGTSDRIYNGANDDGSGTVSVIELAAALGAADPRPRRSILFLTFFGEEKGLLGSRYYGKHPLVPIEKTVAMINLEHVGRTDDTEGPQVDRASMTGFDFSDVGPIFEQAGRATGVTVFKHPRNSDAFFGRSDNQALADLGVPAHSLCTAFLFPDYHGPLDHWDKVDCENMSRVTKTVALGLMSIADSDSTPQWNRENSKAARYVKAWDQRQDRDSDESKRR
jgi:hypothetical protein